MLKRSYLLPVFSAAVEVVEKPAEPDEAKQNHELEISSHFPHGHFLFTRRKKGERNFETRSSWVGWKIQLPFMTANLDSEHRRLHGIILGIGWDSCLFLKHVSSRDFFPYFLDRDGLRFLPPEKKSRDRPKPGNCARSKFQTVGDNRWWMRVPTKDDSRDLTNFSMDVKLSFISSWVLGILRKRTSSTSTCSWVKTV